MSILRAVLLSLPFAVYLLALPEADPPGWAVPFMLAAYLVVPYAIGAVAGWRALPVFAGVFLVASIVHQLFLWHDDPTSSGIDDIPPAAGIVLVVPLMLVPMAVGASSARLWRRRMRG